MMMDKIRHRNHDKIKKIILREEKQKGFNLFYGHYRSKCHVCVFISHMILEIFEKQEKDNYK